MREPDCDNLACPGYCENWDLYCPKDDDRACGLCPEGDGFMQPGSCYDCKVKKRNRSNPRRIKKGGFGV